MKSRAERAEANRLARRAAAGIAAKAIRPRTGQPVRHSSRYRGEREPTFWRPVDPLVVRAIVEAAKLEEVATKPKGKRIGSIGRSGIAILEFFASKVEWRDGRLEPSYTEIKARTGLSIDCIAKTLRRLRDAGFIEWIRRSIKVEDDGTGRQVEQIENAYRILVPAQWADRIKMRVTGWVHRAAKAGQQWRDARADDAERLVRRVADKLAKAKAWAAQNITDPGLRADFIKDAEEQAAIQLN